MSLTHRLRRPRAPRALLTVLLLGSAAMAPASAQVEWLFPGTALPAGYTDHIVVADVDGDGRTDIVSTGPGYPDSVGVALGRPDGTFGPIVEYFGTEGALLVADVTGDGLLDLVGSSEVVADELRVLPGLGSGAFGPAVPTSIELPQYLELRAGDVNLDGALDLVQMDNYGTCQCAHVLLANGDGTFTETASVVPLGPSHVALQVEDLNGDGSLDILACVDDGEVAPQLWLCHGDGAAGFAPAVTADLPMLGYVSALSDLDGDGDLDIIVGGTGTLGKLKAALVRNDGLGLHLYSTKSLTTTVTPGYLGAAALTDLDDDGHPDAVFATVDEAALIELRGTGGFAFADPVTYPLGGDSYADAAGFADVNGDGRLDAWDHRLFTGISVTTSRPDGTFAVPATISQVQNSEDVAVADCNGDGLLDVVSLDSAPPTLAVHTGLGDGSISPAATTTLIPLGDELLLADVDGDDAVDALAWSGGANPGLMILPGFGNGGFGAPLLIDHGAVADATLGDFDADGLLDVVTSRPEVSTVEIRYGLGFGAFSQPQATIVGEDVGALAAGDITADGIADLVAGRVDAKLLWVLDGVGGGPLQPMTEVNLGNAGPRAIAIADIEGDGDLDMTVACYTVTPFGSGGWLLYRIIETLVASSPGTFEPVLTVASPFLADEIVSVDLDHDGHQDVIVAPTELESLPDPSLTPESEFAIGHRSAGPALDAVLPVRAGKRPSGLAVGDLNGDGEPDVVLSHEGEATLKIWINERPTWSTLGHALQSSTGTPLLAGGGEPAAGQVVTVSISLVSTPSSGMLILGLSAEFTSFHNGVLVPAPTVAVAVPGNASFSQPWPAGIPAGTPVYLQAWFKSLLTGEISATNALVTIAQ